MAKVIGVMLTILGGLATLGNLFLYLNSSAFLPYNPSAPTMGLRDVGLSLGVVFFGIMLLAGIALIRFSSEPNIK